MISLKKLAVHRRRPKVNQVARSLTLRAQIHKGRSAIQILRSAEDRGDEDEKAEQSQAVAILEVPNDVEESVIPPHFVIPKWFEEWSQGQPSISKRCHKA